MGSKKKNRRWFLSCLYCKNPALVERKSVPRTKIIPERSPISANLGTGCVFVNCHKIKNHNVVSQENEQSFKPVDSVVVKKNSEEERCYAGHDEVDERRKLEREKRKAMEWPIMKYPSLQIGWYPDLDAIPEHPSP
ncbi:hypothetical protein SUGI_0014820 [Cryptomeria japonica]|nr:hypothetical protein SUGI_0014820 [Cryptomeria japonica]